MLDLFIFCWFLSKKKFFFAKFNQLITVFLLLFYTVWWFFVRLVFTRDWGSQIAKWLNCFVIFMSYLCGYWFLQILRQIKIVQWFDQIVSIAWFSLGFACACRSECRIFINCPSLLFVGSFHIYIMLQICIH